MFTETLFVHVSVWDINLSFGINILNWFFLFTWFPVSQHHYVNIESIVKIWQHRVYFCKRKQANGNKDKEGKSSKLSIRKIIAHYMYLCQRTNVTLAKRM